MVTVRFLPFDRTIQVDEGTKLAEAALLAGIEIGLPCGGQGRCGRCAVLVQEGHMYRPPDQRLSTEDISAGYVLACQTAVQNDVTIYIPPQRIERKLQTDRTARSVEVPFSYDYARDQSLRK